MGHAGADAGGRWREPRGYEPRASKDASRAMSDAWRLRGAGASRGGEPGPRR